MKNFLINSMIAVCALLVWGCTQTIEVPAPVQEAEEQTTPNEWTAPEAETRAIAAALAADEVYGGWVTGDQTIGLGQTPGSVANYSYAGNQDPKYTFRWEYSTDGTTWNWAPGEFDKFWYQPPALYVTTYYRVRVTYNGGNWAYSNNIATITVVTTLNGGSISGAGAYLIGQTPNMLTNYTSPSGGSGSYSYQWQTSNNTTTWTNIPGQTQPNYQPPGHTGAPKSVYYRRQVTSGSQTAYSNTATVQFVAPYSPGTIGYNQSIGWGQSPAKIVNITGPSGGFNGPPTFNYGWYRSHDGVNWINIPNEYNPDYQPPQLTSTTYFRRYAGNTVNTGYSNVVKITVGMR